MHKALRAILVVALCGSSAFGQDELVILSPHWEGVRTEFADAFRARYVAETGRDLYVKWLDVGGGSDILRFVRSEFRTKPEGIGVDLFFGGGTDPYRELKELGLLTPYRLPTELLDTLAPELGGVPLYDADYTWYAATMAGFGIITNKVVMKRMGFPEVRSWEALASPELYSWVGSADPRKSGSVHMTYEIILQVYGWERGWEIVTAMGANVRGFSANAAQTPKDVAVGEVAYGLCIDSYAWAQLREAGEALIGFVMPEDLTVVSGDGIGILKGAPSQPIAERFIRFVLSAEGQKLWTVRKGEPDGPQRFELAKFSVLPGLYAEIRGRSSVTMNPFEWRSSFVYDAEKGSGRWNVVNDLIGALIIDPHQQLRAAWRSEHERGGTLGLKGLARMPISEEEVAGLVESGRWRDAAYRNQMVAKWAAFARDKYASGVAPSPYAYLHSAPPLIGLVLVVAMVFYVRKRSGR